MDDKLNPSRNKAVGLKVQKDFRKEIMTKGSDKSEGHPLLSRDTYFFFRMGIPVLSVSITL
jgi:hypothetical protein